MKVEIIERMTAAQIERAHAAYTQLAAIYEDVCGGPYKAREHREYFGIMDSREELRKRFVYLTCGSHGTRE